MPTLNTIDEILEDLRLGGSAGNPSRLLSAELRALYARVTRMPEGHNKITIVSMAVLASATATLLHEGPARSRSAGYCG